jgi:dCTP deaminase
VAGFLFHLTQPPRLKSLRTNYGGIVILVDRQIDALCRGEVPEELQNYFTYVLGWEVCPAKIPPMVEPYDPDLINPASLDIRVGETAKWRHLDAENGYVDVDLTDYSEDMPDLIYPGERYLVSSLETFHLPNFLCAQFRLKSSRGREWYEHMEAGFADPGWHGSKLTMEIINMDLAPLPLYPGLKMGQLIFSLTLGTPTKNYAQTGRYNGDKTVMESKG